MGFNFDKGIDRRNTNSIKWDFVSKYYGTDNVLPMWVADMDFPAPEPVKNAIKRRAEHGAYGYTDMAESFYDSIIGWMNRRHQWNIKKDWIVYTPGVVPAVNMAIMAYTNPGDKVIIQSPVYFPFFEAVKSNERELIDNQLVLKNGRYEMDFENLEKNIDEKTKLLILCSPHNPVGRVWSKEELLRLGEICIKNNIIIVSDEIHSDIIYGDNRHLPLGSLSDELLNNTITCMAPSKTFNVAGLAASAIIIPDKVLRTKFKDIINRVHIGMANTFGAVALEACYNHGEEWLEELLNYLQENVLYVEKFIEKNIPEIGVKKPEGTYLMWLDFKKLGFNAKQLKEFMIKEAKVALNDGITFGPGGEGFQRMNIACPRSTIKEGLERIERAVRGKL
ncbi:MalY/PatB family protein [Clostridiisalibacter paucivorans]|uniref:MalY/PatB family protein n=1 Tax=Clostridiisalibacter paucivorans TaxID=408753 RepID=UPI0004795D0D|nr:pyridoxal phosphate-dependent aminotransferase [Clostridiisalibacter paucivorans]